MVVFPLAFLARKKLGKSGIPDPLNVMGIYRVQTINGMKVQQKLPFYTPFNPRTPVQVANRNKFKSAMSAWASLTSFDKKIYNDKAKQINLYGVNLFIKKYFAEH